MVFMERACMVTVRLSRQAMALDFMEKVFTDTDFTAMVFQDMVSKVRDSLVMVLLDMAFKVKDLSVTV